MLATFETPNRFAPFDRHSSKTAFTDILPDELAFECAKAFSNHADHLTKRYETGAYESALAQVFEKLDPPVPRGFCRPSLELLIRLKPHRP